MPSRSPHALALLVLSGLVGCGEAGDPCSTDADCLSDSCTFGTCDADACPFLLCLLPRPDDDDDDPEPALPSRPLGPTPIGVRLDGSPAYGACQFLACADLTPRECERTTCFLERSCTPDAGTDAGWPPPRGLLDAGASAACEPRCTGWSIAFDHSARLLCR